MHHLAGGGDAHVPGEARRGFRSRLPHTGDIELLWMRLAAHADVGYVRGVDQAYYRVHKQNMSKSRSMLVNLAQRRLAYEVMLERCADVLPDRSGCPTSFTVNLPGRRYGARRAPMIVARTTEVPMDELEAFARTAGPI